MKRLLCSLLLLIPATAYSFPNEPAGFRTSSWGTPITAIAGLRTVGPPEGTTRRYMRMDESFLYEGGVTLADIQYVAVNGALSQTVLQFDCSQYETLAGLLRKKHGPATAETRNGLSWSGSTTTITLIPAASGKGVAGAEPPLCTLTYVSTPALKPGVAPAK